MITFNFLSSNKNSHQNIKQTPLQPVYSYYACTNLDNFLVFAVFTTLLLPRRHNKIHGGLGIFESRVLVFQNRGKGGDYMVLFFYF